LIVFLSSPKGPGFRFSWLNANQRLSSFTYKYNVLGSLSSSFTTQLTSEIDSTSKFEFKTHNFENEAKIGLRYRPKHKKFEGKVRYSSRNGIEFNYKRIVSDELNVSFDLVNPFCNGYKIGFGVNFEP
jgi:hypothetical protein